MKETVKTGKNYPAYPAARTAGKLLKTLPVKFTIRSAQPMPSHVPYNRKEV